MSPLKQRASADLAGSESDQRRKPPPQTARPTDEQEPGEAHTPRPQSPRRAPYTDARTPPDGCRCSGPKDMGSSCEPLSDTDGGEQGTGRGGPGLTCSRVRTL